MIEPHPKILPFYDAVVKQFHRREYRLSDVTSWEWISPKNTLVGFQIPRANRVNAITEFALYGLDDVLEYNLLSLIVSGQLSIRTAVNAGGAVNIITYFANRELTQDIPCGKYYYKVSDGVETWYSEVITVRDFDGEFDTAQIISVSTGVLEIVKPTPMEIMSSNLSISKRI